MFFICTIRHFFIYCYANALDSAASWGREDLSLCQTKEEDIPFLLIKSKSILDNLYVKGLKKTVIAHRLYVNHEEVNLLSKIYNKIFDFGLFISYPLMM